MIKWIKELYDILGGLLIVLVIHILLLFWLLLFIIIPSYYDEQEAKDRCESAYEYLMELDIVTEKDKIWYNHECKNEVNNGRKQQTKYDR